MVWLEVLLTILVVIGLMGIFTIYNMLKNMTPMIGLDPSVSETVHDIVTSLNSARDTAARVANELEINVAEARQQFTRLVVLLDRLQVDATAISRSGVRIEAESASVAKDLADLQEHARIIEAAPDTPAGAAADFAAGGNNRLESGEEKKRRSPRGRKT